MSLQIPNYGSSAPLPLGLPIPVVVEEQKLADLYRRWFDVTSARTKEEREQAYRVRYQVYCVENAYEDPDRNPHGMEIDEFDGRAPHVLLVHRPTGLVAGTVRLILPRADRLEDSFVIQRLCKEPLVRDPDRFPVARMGEISRFSIAKAFRRRLGDHTYPATDEAALTGQDARRVIPNMCLGLMQGILRMSRENGVEYLCAEMEPVLLRLLARLGIYFEPIGPLIDYHGKRQPCFGKITSIVDRLRDEQPDCWEVVTEEGALAPVH